MILLQEQARNSPSRTNSPLSPDERDRREMFVPQARSLSVQDDDRSTDLLMLAGLAIGAMAKAHYHLQAESDEALVALRRSR